MTKNINLLCLFSSMIVIYATFIFEKFLPHLIFFWWIGLLAYVALATISIFDKKIIKEKSIAFLNLISATIGVGYLLSKLLLN